MNSRRMILSLAAVLLSSCSTSYLGDPPQEEPRVTGNGMIPSVIADNHEAAVLVAGSPLSSVDLSGLASTPGGLDLLRNLVTCALPPDSSLVVRVGGSSVRISGMVGLAPAWARRPMVATERSWVSACLLARSNELGVSVSVSLLGGNRVLGADPQEASDFSVEEGAFYGDVLAPGPVQWFACRGTGSLAAGGMSDRLCAVADLGRPGLTLCGFGFAGSCAAACETSSGGLYSGCRGDLGRLFDQVITVHVTP